MKKSLVFAAVLAACSASAFAADVTLYGIIDLGVQFSAVDIDDGNGRDKNFTMESGQRSGSRFGLRGTEQLGDGYTVGFNLEAGFNADSGTSRTSGQLFDRESLLYVTTPYGEIGLGKTGQAMGSIGRYTLMGWGSAFGTSWTGAGNVNSYIVGAANSNSQNTLTYRTPKFAGFQAQAHYSFDRDSATDANGNTNEGKTEANRQYSAAITYAGGPLKAFLAVESTNYQHLAGSNHPDDALTITLGGNYDFGVLKLFAEAQYFDDVKLTNSFSNASRLGSKDSFAGGALGNNTKKDFGEVEGWGLQVSANIPAWGGNFLVGAAYVEGESAADSSYEFSRWGVHGGYTYAFSKRTDVYAMVGYESDEYDSVTYNKQVEPDAYVVMIGMRHMF